MPVDTHPDQEPATRCVHCPRLLHFDELNRWACRVCEDRAATQISELATWHKQLQDKITPERTAADNAGHVSGATRTAPIPVAIGALDLIGPGGIAAKLQTIEDDWRKTLGWPNPNRTDGIRLFASWRSHPEQTMSFVIPFLRNNLPWACGMYNDVAVDLKLIRDLHRQADVVINGTREAKVPIGHCPVVNDEGVPCGEKLKVSPFACEIKCAGCGTRWARDEWLRLGATIRGFALASAA